MLVATRKRPVPQYSFKQPNAKFLGRFHDYDLWWSDRKVLARFSDAPPDFLSGNLEISQFVPSLMEARKIATKKKLELDDSGEFSIHMNTAELWEYAEENPSEQILVEVKKKPHKLVYLDERVRLVGNGTTRDVTRKSLLGAYPLSLGAIWTLKE